MNNKRNPSSKLKQMLEALKKGHVGPNGIIAIPNSAELSLEDEYVEYEPRELPQYFNAYRLYSDVALAIKCESDLATVREIALYYLDIICQEMPDTMAHRISQRILG